MSEAILTLNAGSSSIKFALFRRAEPIPRTPEIVGQIDGIGARTHIKVKDPAGAVLEDVDLPSATDSRAPRGPRPKSGHDMSREFRVLSALKRGFAECPGPVHYCADEAVIGAPFYVVERIRGVILRRDYPPELPATPGLVRAQQTALVDALARLHGLDYRALGLAELGRPDGTSRARSRAGPPATHAHGRRTRPPRWR